MRRAQRRARQGSMSAMVDVLMAMVLVMAAVLVTARVEHAAAMSSEVVGDSETAEELEISELKLVNGPGGPILQGDGRSVLVSSCAESGGDEAENILIAVPLDGSVDRSIVEEAVRCARSWVSEGDVRWSFE